MSENSLQHTIVKNTLFVTFGAIVLKAVNFLYTVAVVRQLGDDRFGNYATVIAFVGLFGILAELGVSQYVMREIARQPDRGSFLFWNLIALRLVLAVLGVIGITVGAVVWGFNKELVFGVFIYTLTFFWSSILIPLETVLTAYERFDYVTYSAVIGQIGTVALGVMVLWFNLGFLALIMVGLLAMIPQIVLTIWAVRRHRLVARPIELRPRLWPQLIRASIPFGVISLALTIALSLDTVMLAKWYPSNVVGWYSVAYGLVRSLLFFFWGFNTAIVPSLSKAYMHDIPAVQKWYYRSVKFGFLMTIPIAVGGMILAEPLFFFLYGADYLPAVPAFQILVWDIPLLMYASLCGNMATITGEERGAARIYVTAAVANLVLNAIFIPIYGIMGAAVVSVITDLVAGCQFYFLLQHKLRLPPIWPQLSRIALAAGLMGIAVGLAVNQNFVLLIIGGVCFYGLSIILLRVLDKDEWALLGRLLNRVKPAYLTTR